LCNSNKSCKENVVFIWVKRFCDSTANATREYRETNGWGKLKLQLDRPIGAIALKAPIQ
jgi:hypothetical protein